MYIWYVEHIWFSKRPDFQATWKVRVCRKAGNFEANRKSEAIFSSKLINQFFYQKTSETLVFCYVFYTRHKCILCMDRAFSLKCISQLKNFRLSRIFLRSNKTWIATKETWKRKKQREKHAFKQNDVEQGACKYRPDMITIDRIYKWALGEL